MIKQKREYLEMIKENRGRGKDAFIEVWSDESYGHQHSQIEYKIFDPNDTDDIIARMQHKGPRLCIIAAMWTSADLTDGGILHASYKTFRPQDESKSKSKSKDYHSSFDHKYYMGLVCEQPTAIIG